MGRSTVPDTSVPAGALSRDVSFEPLIRASHQRSLGYGLEASQQADYGYRSGDLSLTLEKNRHLVSHAMPVMETLYQQIVNTHNMVVLTDAQGTILHVCGDNDFLQRADQVALKPGVNWSEQSKGTNAIGTALAEGEPMVVHADEHFLSANHFLTCSCAPVRDPFGAVVGALDITGEQRSFHRHTLALVRMSAQMIENHFFADAFPQAICVRFHSRPEFIGTLVEGIAAFSPSGKFLSANRSAQFQLEIPLSGLMAHTFSSLFGLSLPAVIDQHRRASTNPLSSVLHNGVRVFLRLDYSASSLFLPGAATMGHQHPEPATAGDPITPLTESATPVRKPSSLTELHTGDAQMARVTGQLQKIRGRDIPVLILGETGTGKERLARAIHNDSPRKQAPFVAINCASIPEGLIESELFGYAEGAFTGGNRRGRTGKILSAHGGTLFLDEIGDMPIGLQARLLRVLEERCVTPLGTDKNIPVNIALVCATHRDLVSQIRSGQFREDLYYRINGLVVRLPRLQDRTDLAALVNTILQTEGITDLILSDDVMACFHGYPWPGNIRQLVNVLRTAERMVDEDRILKPEHLPDDLLSALVPSVATTALAMPSDKVSAPAIVPLHELEWSAIQRSLLEHDGNVSAAARSLGVSRNTIYRRRLGQVRH
jgi:transcriptional regulator of acetoin/glycerol metabolism